MLVKPKFYDNFACTADKCPDTCCAGWEIDVDGDTAEYYSTLSGSDGEFVRSRLINTENGCVRLCREGERCRFLRCDNLCELILRLGDEALCDICREHPRFYSGTDAITEAGMGLCCPEAARLWLTEPCQFVLADDGITPDSDEKALLDIQLSLIHDVCEDTAVIYKRLSRSVDSTDASCDKLYAHLRELYASLEALDPHFSVCFQSTLPSVTHQRFYRLAAYFIFRYFFELGEELCLKFTAVSLIMTAAMGGELETSAKNYSKEVEYDTDNLARIYDFLDDCNGVAALLKKAMGG